MQSLTSNCEYRYGGMYAEFLFVHAFRPESDHDLGHNNIITLWEGGCFVKGVCMHGLAVIEALWRPTGI